MILVRGHPFNIAPIKAALILRTYPFPEISLFSVSDSPVNRPRSSRYIRVKTNLMKFRPSLNELTSNTLILLVSLLTVFGAAALLHES